MAVSSGSLLCRRELMPRVEESGQEGLLGRCLFKKDRKISLNPKLLVCFSVLFIPRSRMTHNIAAFKYLRGCFLLTRKGRDVSAWCWGLWAFREKFGDALSFYS